MRRRKTYPGTIYKPANANTIYIKYKGKRIATGLKATKEGYRIAELRLEQMYRDAHGLESQSIMTVSDAWHKFTLEHPKHMSKTIGAYKYAINAMFKLSDHLTKTTVINSVTTYVNTTKHSPATVNINLRHIQAFINYYTTLDYLPNIPLSKFKHRVRTNVKSFTDAEILRLLRYFVTNNKEMALIISLCYNTGARVVDAFSLLKEDIKGNVITWRNKKTKDLEPRKYPDRTIRIVNKLIELNPNDTHLVKWHYPNVSFPYKLFRKAFEDLGMDRNGRSLQELRVSFRMRLRRAGVPREVIQYYLRHGGTELIDKHYTDQGEDMSEHLTKI